MVKRRIARMDRMNWVVQEWQQWKGTQDVDGIWRPIGYFTTLRAAVVEFFKECTGDVEDGIKCRDIVAHIDDAEARTRKYLEELMKPMSSEVMRRLLEERGYDVNPPVKQQPAVVGKERKGPIVKPRGIVRRRLKGGRS